MSTAASVRHIRAGYDGRTVLSDISFDVGSGERLLLIGRNGCGKTTLLKVIAGQMHQAEGRVLLDSVDVSRMPLHLRMNAGVGYLMQTRNVFPSLTTNENLSLAFWQGHGRFEHRRDWVLEMFPWLKDKLDRRAGLLSGGERQALAVGMVMMRPVRLLLLDEPTAGLSPKAAGDILEAIHGAHLEAGFASILVEHNLRLVHPWISRVLALRDGTLCFGGADPSVLLDHDRLQDVYFG